MNQNKSVIIRMTALERIQLRQIAYDRGMSMQAYCLRTVLHPPGGRKLLESERACLQYIAEKPTGVFAEGHSPQAQATLTALAEMFYLRRTSASKHACYVITPLGRRQLGPSYQDTVPESRLTITTAVVTGIECNDVNNQVGLQLCIKLTAIEREILQCTLIDKGNNYCFIEGSNAKVDLEIKEALDALRTRGLVSYRGTDCGVARFSATDLGAAAISSIAPSQRSEHVVITEVPGT